MVFCRGLNAVPNRGSALVGVVAVCLFILDGPTAARGNDSPPLADAQDIVYLSARGPVFLRLRLRIDDMTLHQAAVDFASSIFATLDEDGDQLITLEQAATAPGVGRTIPEDELAQWDRQPPDLHFSPDEFTSFASNELGKLFFMRAVQSRRVQAVNLFDRVDVNQDHRLTNEEIAHSSEMLAIHDFDDDETISSLKLLPFRNPIAPRVTSEPETSSTDMPFVTLLESSLDTAVDELMKRYGSASVHGSLVVSAEDFGMEPHRLEPFDANTDGRLDPSEFAVMCRHPRPDIELSIHLPRGRRVRPRITVESEGVAELVQVAAASSSRVKLTIDNTEIELRAIGSRSQASDNRSFYKLKFLTADGDKNGYLEATEFAGLELPDADFATLDRNGDGQLFRDELVMFLDGDTMAAQSRIVMSVLANNQSLFEILDADYDSRLAPRELFHATDRLASLDQNQDGLLHKSELAQNYRISFSMGEPPLFQRSMANPQRPMPTPRTSRNTTGPTWFRHMDRNQDGDVSWREFLGPRAVFDELDSDHDALIDAQEAGD